jgi:hypothetical protein
MKALVLEAYNHLVYEDVPEPEIGPDCAAYSKVYVT